MDLYSGFATLFRSSEGFLVNDKIVGPTDIIAQLSCLPSMTSSDATSLLYPSDRQNVPKAVSLIQHLLQARDLPETNHPGENRSRKQVNFMSNLVGFFLQPFIIMSMTLSQQLQSLSTYAYLAAAMYSCRQLKSTNL
jgi:hypothetical protein